MLRILRLASLGLVLTSGCSGWGTDGTPGELGKGAFTYACSGDGDPVCRSSTAFDAWAVDFGPKGDFPAAVATGAHFGISYYGDVYQGLERLTLSVRPAAEDLVTAKGNLLVKQPGAYAFLARTTTGVTADFMHLEAVQPHALEIWSRGMRAASLSVGVGWSVDVGVLAIAADGTVLGGALDWSWSVDAPTVRVQSHGIVGSGSSSAAGDDEISIIGVSGGKAVLTVSNGAMSRTINVTIAGAP